MLRSDDIRTATLFLLQAEQMAGVAGVCGPGIVLARADGGEPRGNTFLSQLTRASLKSPNEECLALRGEVEYQPLQQNEDLVIPGAACL